MYYVCQRFCAANYVTPTVVAKESNSQEYEAAVASRSRSGLARRPAPVCLGLGGRQFFQNPRNPQMRRRREKEKNEKYRWEDVEGGGEIGSQMG